MTREFPTNDLIKEVLGSNHPIPLGWHAIIEIYNAGENYKSNEGEDSLFIRPDTAVDRDNYHMSVGRILMLGSACFKGDKFKDWDLTPSVGDFVSFPKYQGTFKTVLNSDSGKEVQTIQIEDCVITVIERNPSLCSTHHFIGQ